MTAGASSQWAFAETDDAREAETRLELAALG